MKPEISIITVGMNHLSYVKEMLASLYSVGSPSVSFEVIFVDNCSTDGTADYIRNNYPTIKLIENQTCYRELYTYIKPRHHINARSDRQIIQLCDKTSFMWNCRTQVTKPGLLIAIFCT